MIRSDTSHSVFPADTEFKKMQQDLHTCLASSGSSHCSVKGPLSPISPYILGSWNGVSECITATELVLPFTLTSTAQFLLKLPP